MSKYQRADSQEPVAKASEPTTLREAIAAERAKWGDAWTSKRDPIPMVCVTWLMGVEDRIRPVVAFPVESYAKRIHAQLDAKQITRQQADARLAKATDLRAMLKSWVDSDNKERRMQSRWTDCIRRRDRLATLVTSGYIARPTSRIILEWIGLLPVQHRAPIDHDQRMRDAEGSFDRRSA